MSETKKSLLILLALVVLIAGVFGATILLKKPHRHDFGPERPMGKDEKGYRFVQYCCGCNETKERYYDALVTFIDDDAKTQAMLHWERIIDATGIEMTAALIPGKIGKTTDYENWASYAGWDLLEKMEQKGVDFVHHTYSHQRLGTMTGQEIYEDLKKSKEILEKKGIYSDILVYPFYNYNDEVVEITKKFFEAGFIGGDETVQDVTTNPYLLNRMKIEDLELTRDITFDGTKTVTCHGIKSAQMLIDEMNTALKEGSWLVYVVHAYDSPSGMYFFDEESEKSIIDFCKHAQALGNVKIISATEGLVAAQPAK